MKDPQKIGTELEQLRAMLERAEIDFVEDSPNGITPDISLPFHGIIFKFNDDSELETIINEDTQ